MIVTNTFSWELFYKNPIITQILCRLMYYYIICSVFVVTSCVLIVITACYRVSYVIIYKDKPFSLILPHEFI